MKKFILLVSILLIHVSLSTNVYAQANASDSIQVKRVVSERDLIESQNEILDNIENNTESIEYYKLYPTTNMWTFIKLDTRNGRLWQVQFDVSGNNRFEVSINSTDLTYIERKVSRFELYPTQNMYNFLLLDKLTGNIWQAQWSTKSENRGIVRVN